MLEKDSEGKSKNFVLLIFPNSPLRELERKEIRDEPDPPEIDPTKKKLYKESQAYTDFLMTVYPNYLHISPH